MILDIGWDFIAAVACDMWQCCWKSWICQCAHPADSHTHSLRLAHPEAQNCLDAQHENAFHFFVIYEVTLKTSTFAKFPCIVVRKTPIVSD